MGAIDGAGTVLAPIWDAEADRVLLLSQASHAYALMHATLRATGRADPIYWFPAYFCGSALDSLRRLTSNIRFYPVHDDFSPDWEACEQMARQAPPDLFSLPHFFGIEAATAEARAFCDRFGALLHEDGAHSLVPFGQLGKSADFVTYSPRKFLQIADGGLLIVRGAALVAKADAAAVELAGRAYSPLRWQWRQLRRRFVGRSRNSPLPTRTLDWDPPQIPHFQQLWISHASRSALVVAASTGGIAALATRRQRNARDLGERLSRSHELRHLPPHPGAAPYWTAFRGRDEGATLEAINALRADGIEANTWPRLPPEVKAAPERYGAAVRIRRTLIRIPVA